jgi:hypothetical protein
VSVPDAHRPVAARLAPSPAQSGQLARRTLNARDPALDFSHLDRMAESLWMETEPAMA